MLGIGNVVTAGSRVANVVLRGLKAWFKSDKTQAPLGEERIENSDFNTGPELFVNGGFTKDGALTNTSALPGGIDWNIPDINPTSYSASISNNSLTIVVTDHTVNNVGRAFGNTTEKYYRTVGVGFPTDSDFVLTYTVESVTGDIAASGEFRVFTGDSYSAIPRTVGTHTEYFTFGGTAGPRTNIAFKLDGANGSITISNLSVKRVNHGKLATSNLLPSITNLSNWSTSGDKVDDSGNTITSVSSVSGGILISVPDTDDNNSLNDFSYVQQTEASADWNYDVGCQYLLRASILPGAGADGKQIRFQDNTSNSGGLVSSATTTTLAHDVNGNGVMKHVQFVWTPNASSDTIIVARETQNSTAYNFTIKELKMYKLNPYSWTNKTGWEIKDGFAECVSDNNNLEVFIDAETNREYQVEFDILSRTSGGLVCDINNGNDGTPSGGGTFNSVGHHKVIIKAPNSLTDKGKLRFFGGSFRGTIGNISCRAITNSVKDFSNNRNDAVLYSGTCLNFANTGGHNSDYIDTGLLDNTYVTYTTKFTVATWFNASEMGNYMIFSTGQNGDNRFYLWTPSDGGVNTLRLAFGNNPGTGIETGSIPSLELNRWYRVVVVVDGLMARVYLDGKFVYAKESTLPFTTQDSLAIGRHGATDNYYFRGKQADFQIYDVAWSNDDVSFDYNNPDKDVIDDIRTKVLGQEVITNGNFTTDPFPNDWTKLNDQGNGVDDVIYENGKVRIKFDHTSSDNAAVGISQDVLTVGRLYEVTIGVEEILAGSEIQVYNARAVIRNLGDGTHTFRLFATSDDFRIYRHSSGVSCDLYVTNASVKEITTSESILPHFCKGLFRLNEGQNSRVYNAAPILGKELNTFANPTSVTNESVNIPTSTDGTTGFTSSKITADSSVFSNGSHSIKFQAIGNGDRSYLDLDSILTANKLYVLKVDVRHLGSGDDFILQFNNTSALNKTGTGSSVQTALATITSSNIAFTTYTKFFTHSANTKYFGVKEDGSNNNAAGYIDNLTIKEITLPNSALQTSFVDANWVYNQPYIPQFAMSSYSKKGVFTGVNEKVDLGSMQTIADNEPISISFWYAIGVNADTPENYILGTATGEDYIRIEDQNELLYWRINNSVVTFDFPDLSENKLSHICVTRASGNDPIAKCYVNGVLTNTVAGSGNSDGTYRYRYIGSYGSTSSSTCFLDELSIFNKELSSAEVQEIFNDGTALDIRDHSSINEEKDIDGDFSEFTAYGSSSGYNLTSDSVFFTNHGFTSDGLNGLNRLSSILNGFSIEIVTVGDNTWHHRLTTDISSHLTIGKRYVIQVELKSKIPGEVYFRLSKTNGQDPQTGSGEAQRVEATNEFQLYQKEFLCDNATSQHIQIFPFTDTKIQGNIISARNLNLIEKDLLGYWRNNGVDTWTDLSPYGNNGTSNISKLLQLQEVPLFKKDSLGLPMNRVRQKSFNFDKNGYAEIPSQDYAFGKEDFSLECWVKYAYEDQGSGWNVILSNGDISTSGGSGFNLATNSARFGVRLNPGSQTRYFGPSSGLNEGQWYHAVITRSNTVIKTYLDGDERDDHTQNNAGLNVDVDTATPLRIGVDHYVDGNSLATRQYTSLIDDVKLYNRVLSASEVKRNFRASSAKHSTGASKNWSDDFDDSFI